MKSLEKILGRVSHGDCVAQMNSLPEGSIDLAFADPPFNIGYDYDVYNDQKEHNEYLDWSEQWIGAVHRALKPTGTFWLAIGDEYAAELKLLIEGKPLPEKIQPTPPGPPAQAVPTGEPKPAPRPELRPAPGFSKG